MTDFDLRALIRGAFADTPDHREAWDKVRANLDAETVWLAIDAMGPDYCRRFGGMRRQAALSSIESAAARKERGVGAPRKAAAFSKRWAKAMETSIPLSDDGSLTKRLGDCAPDEVRFAAQIRRTNEKANRVWAERFEALAEKMRIHRAAVVSALDPNYFWEAMA